MMQRFRALLLIITIIAYANGLNAQCTGALTFIVGGGSTTMSSNILNISSTANLFAGMSVVGTGIPGGTTIVSVLSPTQVQLSANATTTAGPLNYTFGPGLVPNTSWAPATLPGGSPWLNNYPPNSVGGTPNNCEACPSLFTTTICNDQYARMYMCPTKVYTISLCNSPTIWNSTLTITDGTWALAGGIINYDNNSCPDGSHATLTFSPTVAGLYYIRVFQNPCLMPSTTPSVVPLQCGTLEITCSPAPSAPPNDNPCGVAPLGAEPLTVGPTCAPTSTGTAWSTTTLSIPAPGCATFTGSDVWYSVVVPAPGAFALQVTHVGAADLAMAVYSNSLSPSCSGTWTLLGCSDDIAPGVLNPYLSLNLPALIGQTVWVRIFPEGGGAFGGTFEICAVEVIPPVNDNPCSATPVPVTAGCSTITSSNENATATSGVPVPTCDGTGPYNDVWFTVVVPNGGAGVIINTGGTALNDAIMAVYTVNPVGNCAGTFTQVTGACLNPAGAAMPSITVNQNGTTIVDGTTLYVRVWNNTNVFGPFTICATPTTPPANDNPCGAFAVPVQYGCMFTGYSNAFAGETGPTAPNTATNGVPDPVAPCATTTPAADVWFTIQVPNPVPPAGLVLTTDDGTLTNAALAVYRITPGTSCAGGDLALTQIGCSTNGSPFSASMPQLTLPAAGLVANETLYIRVWRESGPTTNNTFQLCARRTDAVPGDCNFTLQMFDTGGDGWNGSYVTIEVGGVPTNYTINSANGSITFAANFGQSVFIYYTAAGGFQNQISYQLLAAANGGLIFASGTPPATGLVLPLTVGTDCNVPPLPQEDCVGAHRICDISTAQSFNPQNTGAVDDLGPANRGCLITDEHMGAWYYFRITTSGQLGFTVNPFPYGVSDYDFGVWGPYTSFSCPPVGPPIRCSWADGPSLTGLNYTATDLSEGVFGDSWTRYLDVIGGQWYILYLDNWYLTGDGFDLTFQLQGGATIACTLPVELLNFTGKAIGKAVHLKWETASERLSDHFIIERSTDGVHFEAIGRVEAAGNSSTLREYAHVDTEPGDGLNYYRLQQVDLDGTNETSHVVTILFRTAFTEIEVVPNPALDNLQAIFDLPAEQAFQWSVIDASGRNVLNGTNVAVDGPDRLEITVQGIESGAYALSIRSSGIGSIGQARFVKQ